jgi:hypothetical protein
MQNPYLYLEKPEYAETWINGGKISIKLASCYKSDERNGIYTLDENIVSNNSYQSKLDFDNISRLLHIFNSSGIPGFDTVVRSRGKNNGLQLMMKYEDGYILSFCTKKDKKIMEKLGKRVCVQINDVFKLKQFIDEQMRCLGKYDRCKYTKRHCRDHFLKSKEDEWQKECRIFWNIIKSGIYRNGCGFSSRLEEFWVDIPKNTARIYKF